MASRQAGTKNRVARVRALRPRHVLLIGTVYVALVRAQLVVWRRPTGTLVQSAAPNEPSTDIGMVPERVARLAQLTHWAARGLPIRPVCLVRAVALTWLLTHYGYAGSVVRAGVRFADGRFEAHAWVEYLGRPIGERAEQLASFAPIATVNVRAFS